MSRLENKIEAKNRSVFEVLDKKKYTVDFYQREYSWQQGHIEQLVTDLTSAFLNEYDNEHDRAEVENYNSYYLGPFVLSDKGSKRSIIDGQQRLTSLTLFLVYLNNLQKEYGVDEPIESLIFSKKFGALSFNIDVPERVKCLQALFESGTFQLEGDEDASTVNMLARYEDIEQAFPKEIGAAVLPYFIDWFKENVVLVEIIAYSDDNAYTIFETMNDRGLNLTPTEMLKGFLLSRFKDDELREQANSFWKSSILRLHEFDKDEDQRFIQAWLRAKYAESIRQGSVGSKNEDFEKVGTRFHNWVRDNLTLMTLKPDSQKDFDQFINRDFKFFLNAYLKVRSAEQTFEQPLEHIYYINRWGIATSLSYPLLLASLSVNDDNDTVNAKLNLVAKYIETFVVKRSVNFKKFASSSIRYTMYSLVKEIRNKSLDELQEILSKKLNEMDKTWTGLDNFRLHGQNKRFVKFLLSRISGYIDKLAGSNNTFDTYFTSPNGKPFEVEHVWANKFNEHKDEFEQQVDFDEYRNRLGALVLLPRGTNQSYGSKSYSEKLPHYVKENLLVQSLCELTYKNNPNFNSLIHKYDLPFEAHNEFNKADIIKRQALYRSICESVWAFDAKSCGGLHVE